MQAAAAADAFKTKKQVSKSGQVSFRGTESSFRGVSGLCLHASAMSADMPAPSDKAPGGLAIVLGAVGEPQAPGDQNDWISFHSIGFEPG